MRELKVKKVQTMVKRIAQFPRPGQSFHMVAMALAVLMAATSCDSGRLQNARVIPEAEPAVSPRSSNQIPPCDQIDKIRILPYKDNQVDDQIYNALVAEGDKAIPCLIKKITDTTQMPDPRQAPKVTGVTVGDVAFFMVVRLSKADFAEFLPPDVQQSYRKNGVYGYFEQINESNNRAQLQQNISKWYEQKTGMKLK